MRRAVSFFWSGVRSLTGAQRVFVLAAGAAMGLLAWLAQPGPRAAKAAQRLAAAHTEGHAGNVKDYVEFWIPRVALGELIVCGLLLLCVKWLVHPLPTARIQPRLPLPGSGRRFWLLTALIIAWSAWMNAPRLDFSLWGDEENTLRKCVAGEYQRQEDGSLKFRPLTWQETVFRYNSPNNHILHSILARFSHETFAGDLSQAEGFYFDERAMRLPAFFCGLAGLGALAWLGRVLGRPGLGLAAAAVMSLHPWFVRYGSEARGYGLLLLLVPLAMVFLIKAARSGGWSWWLGFGVAQFLILWSYPGALHLLVALNASALCVVFLPRTPRHWRVAQGGRWVVACALGAMLSAMMLAPCVQPLQFYLKTERMQGGVTVPWLKDALSLLLTGQTWQPWAADNPWCLSWQQCLAADPLLTWLGAGLLLFTPLAGLVWWWRQGGVLRALLPALLIMPPLLILQSGAMGTMLYSWYLLPGLSGIVLLGAGGLMAFAQGLRARAVAAPGIGLALLLLAAFAWGTQPQRWLYRHVPTEQMREGVKLTRQISLASDPRIQEVLTLDILMTPRSYDPAALPVRNDDPAELKRWLDEADAGAKPLFAHFGHPNLVRALRPKLMAIFENPEIFEPVATLHGLDDPYTRLVFRYRPGSAHLVENSDTAATTPSGATTDSDPTAPASVPSGATQPPAESDP